MSNNNCLMQYSLSVAFVFHYFALKININKNKCFINMCPFDTC